MGKTLQKKFQKYIAYKKDSHQLLYYELKHMFTEAVNYAHVLLLFFLHRLIGC